MLRYASVTTITTEQVMVVGSLLLSEPPPPQAFASPLLPCCSVYVCM